jgi:hypothetical protein
VHLCVHLPHFERMARCSSWRGGRQGCRGEIGRQRLISSWLCSAERVEGAIEMVFGPLAFSEASLNDCLVEHKHVQCFSASDVIKY